MFLQMVAISHIGKVLLVEDNIETMRLVSDILSEAGFKVFVANSGEKALLRVDKVQPDLILLDIMLPGLSGYEVCVELKKMPTLQAVPVIFSSALGEAFDKVKAFEVGAVDYVTKPIQGIELVERVKTHVSLYRLRLQLEETVAERTAELTQRNAELHEAKERAEASNKAKSEFLSTVTHELRTPLNPIIGFSELIRDSLTDEELISYVNYIETSARHLLGLVNDILEFSRFEFKEQQLTYSEVNVRELLIELSQAYKTRAEEKKISFNFFIAEDTPECAYTDGKRLRQILDNLLNNAVKFTLEGGVIFITEYNKENSQIKCCVKDTGIGISEDQKVNVFEKFYQVDSSMTRAFEGLGLGLSIVQRYVELLGGRVIVESVEGKGSSFCIEIPYLQQPL